jgi:hypothetical protein
MEYSAKTSLPLYILGIILAGILPSLQIWYNLHSYIVCQRGRESKRAYISLTKYPFLAINAKGEESISPKQKDRTTNFKNMFFQFVFKKFFQIGTLFLI